MLSLPAWYQTQKEFYKVLKALDGPQYFHVLVQLALYLYFPGEDYYKET